jgi:hypothetical protein
MSTSLAAVGAKARKLSCQMSEQNGATKVAASLQGATEELSIFYKDPQGDIQGPVMRVDIIDWFEAGFFSTGEICRFFEGTLFAPFSHLMPHLGLKPCPLPRFCFMEEVRRSKQGRTCKSGMQSPYLSLGSRQYLSKDRGVEGLWGRK